MRRRRECTTGLYKSTCQLGWSNVRAWKTSRDGLRRTKCLCRVWVSYRLLYRCEHLLRCEVLMGDEQLHGSGR